MRACRPEIEPHSRGSIVADPTFLPHSSAVPDTLIAPAPMATQTPGRPPFAASDSMTGAAAAVADSTIGAGAAAPAVPATREGSPREGNEGLIRLTDAAGTKVCALCAREKQGDYLRVAITGGGCNGLSYKLRFAMEPKRGDILVRTAGAAVLVDPRTALYLKGTVLDYSTQLIAGGFKFTNPNAKASCSCGESFAV